MSTALASGDREAVARMLAPGFLSVDVSGNETTAAQMLEAVARKVDVTKRSTETTLTAIEERNGEAIVLQFYTLKAAPDAVSSLPKELQNLSKDTWQLRDGTWLLRRTETQEIEILARNGDVTYRSRAQ